MVAYRSADEAARLRVAELEEQLAAERAELGALRGELSRTEADWRRWATRLADAGPSAGEADVGRDRIGLAAMLLAVSGLPLLGLHAHWHAYVSSDPTVVPAVLLLGVPGALAAIVAAPHVVRRPGPRARLAACRVGFALGLAIALAAVVHVALGRFL